MFDDTHIENEMNNNEIEQNEGMNTQQSEQKQETDYAKNMRLLREKAERMERERDEALRRSNHYEQQMNTRKNNEQQQQDEEDDLGVGSDDIVEGKHVKKIFNKFKNEINDLKNQVNTYKQTSLEARLIAHDKEFLNVVTAENIQKLREINPTLVEILNESKDEYKKLKAAYDAIIAANIYKKGHGAPRDYESSLMENNSNRPKTASMLNKQPGKSALSEAHDFEHEVTEERMKKEWQEMQRIRQGY